MWRPRELPIVEVPRAPNLALSFGIVLLTGIAAGVCIAIILYPHVIAGSNAAALPVDWVYFGLIGTLALTGLGLGAVLITQNRRLALANQSLQAAAAELRRAKEDADASSEAKSRFLATISHELRTPLNAVIGFSEIISGETFGPVGKPTYREYAGDILRSGQHMLELVNDILTMAKLDAGRYELDLAPVNLRDAAERAVHMFRGSRLADGRRIVLTPDAEWPSLEADERALRQMLLNLLSNAAKFSDPDTPIEIRCDAAPGREMTLIVVDHGIGMTPEEAALVVLPFHQADSRLARKYEGSGLGLSIVAGLMACHGGRLAIDSQPGVGSRISLVFPTRLTQAGAVAAMV